MLFLFSICQRFAALPFVPHATLMRFLLFILSLIGIYAERIKLRKMIAVLQIIFAFGGVFFAGRQLWLQALPPGQAPACMPDLGVLVRYFPWSDVLHALFWGAGIVLRLIGLGLASPCPPGRHFISYLR